MLNYKDQLDAFKVSARFYPQNLKQFKTLREQSGDAGNEQMVAYLQEDLAFVENTLNAVLEKYGPGARLIVYKLFVEGKTQIEVAEEYGITRRQLQYSLNKWMKSVFEGEGTVSVHG